MWITSCSLYSLGLIMKARCCLMETEWVVCAVYHRLSSASPSAPNSPDSLSQPLLFVSHGSDLIAHVRGRMKRESPGCSKPKTSIFYLIWMTLISWSEMVWQLISWVAIFGTSLKGQISKWGINVAWCQVCSGLEHLFINKTLNVLFNTQYIFYLCGADLH